VETLTADDLEAWLRSHGIAAEVVRLHTPTATVPAAADALGVSADQILKTVVFLAAGEPVLVVARGNERIETRRLARHLGYGRRRFTDEPRRSPHGHPLLVPGQTQNHLR
jgi:prolyl-tRNA synthetase